MLVKRRADEAQIEESVPELDWRLWTQPAPDGLGMGEAFVGDAVRGYYH